MMRLSLQFVWCLPALFPNAFYVEVPLWGVGEHMCRTREPPWRDVAWEVAVGDLGLCQRYSLALVYSPEVDVQAWSDGHTCELDS